MSRKDDSQSVFVKDAFFEVEITDIGNDGEGIGKIDGYTLFIKDAVIGDRVKAKIMKPKRTMPTRILKRSSVLLRTEWSLPALWPDNAEAVRPNA